MTTKAFLFSKRISELQNLKPALLPSLHWEQLSCHSPSSPENVHLRPSSSPPSLIRRTPTLLRLPGYLTITADRWEPQQLGSSPRPLTSPHWLLAAVSKPVPFQGHWHSSQVHWSWGAAGVAGSGAGIGTVFGSLIIGLCQEPLLKQQLFSTLFWALPSRRPWGSFCLGWWPSSSSPCEGAASTLPQFFSRVSSALYVSFSPYLPRQPGKVVGSGLTEGRQINTVLIRKKSWASIESVSPFSTWFCWCETEI